MTATWQRGPIDCKCIDGCRHFTRPYFQYWVTATALTGPDYGSNYYLYRFDDFYPPNCEWLAVSDHFAGPSTELLRKIPLFDGGGALIGFQWNLLISAPAGVNNWSLDVIPGIYTAIPVDHEGWGSCDKLVYILPHVIFGAGFPAAVIASYPDACDDADYPRKVRTHEITWQP